MIEETRLVGAKATIKQIKDLTNSIEKISRHLLETKQKDKLSKRGMLIKIGIRKRLQKYLAKKYKINNWKS